MVGCAVELSGPVEAPEPIKGALAGCDGAWAMTGNSALLRQKLAARTRRDAFAVFDTLSLIFSIPHGYDTQSMASMAQTGEDG
jgi:hypothetical protein